MGQLEIFDKRRWMERLKTLKACWKNVRDNFSELLIDLFISCIIAKNENE
jgi:hypothetical protein